MKHVGHRFQEHKQGRNLKGAGLNILLGDVKPYLQGDWGLINVSMVPRNPYSRGSGTAVPMYEVLLGSTLCELCSTK